jgi:hypothetical protein
MNQLLKLIRVDPERATGAESGATMGPSVHELVASESDALTVVTICPIIVEPGRFRF